MSYHVTIEHRAARALTRIERGSHRTVERIDTAIKALADNPRPSGCIKLSGLTDTFRLRVGDYRVIYVVADEVRVVTVTRIGHRKDIYER